MQVATEYLGLTESELDELIKKRLSEGWYLASNKLLTPNDHRIGWCAEWLPYKDMHIPHWIKREV